MRYKNKQIANNLIRCIDSGACVSEDVQGTIIDLVSVIDELQDKVENLELMYKTIK